MLVFFYDPTKPRSHTKLCGGGFSFCRASQTAARGVNKERLAKVMRVCECVCVCASSESVVVKCGTFTYVYAYNTHASRTSKRRRRIDILFFGQEYRAVRACVCFSGWRRRQGEFKDEFLAGDPIAFARRRVVLFYSM